MPSEEFPIPETRVLAVASHVVYGNVGNTMAVQVLRFMGCEVAALNTVQFSNHTGYKQVRGTKATADEIRALYEGLAINHLTDFDVMLSGYAPGAEAVNAVGAIARDLKKKAERSGPGSFFWILDPVMGDQGKLYVKEDVVPAYKALIRDADLIVPNQFELEILTDTSITSLPDLTQALERLHTEYDVPHVVVTSVRGLVHRKPSEPEQGRNGEHTTTANPSASASTSASPTLSVIGSSRTSSGKPRAFRIDVPDIDCYFSGTGDMFGALLAARLREAVAAVPQLAGRPSWQPADDVRPLQLPLCAAVCKVLATMSRILEHTKAARDRELDALPPDVKNQMATDAAMHHSFITKAAELRIVRHWRWLLDPEVVFEAEEL